MKNIVKIFSLALAMCMTLMPIAALAADNDSVSFEMRVLRLAEEYGVTISVAPASNARTVMTAEQEEAELAELEKRLAAGKEALEENNRQAEEAWQAILESGRLDEETSVLEGVSSRATHTVYRYQTIGSYYPDGTTIRCYVTANRVYSDERSRYLWGSVVATGSSLYSGKGSAWKETDCETQKIDGGRTLYVQVWGDLEEKYTSWFKEYTVTSKGWRLWYEARCPA